MIFFSMRRFIFFLLSCVVCLVVNAQSCYHETRDQGISFYNKGQYETAIKAFTAAKACPDKPLDNDLDNWIRKCKSRSRSESSIPASVPTKSDTYIRVNNLTTIASEHSPQGGSTTFRVSTDAKSWTTWGVPSWCSIESKTSTSFCLKVSANPSSDKRSDYMEVRTPKGHSARIAIKQNGKASTGPVKIENVTVSHDETIDGEPGMEIRMKLTISGRKDKNCRAVAYFYDNSGNALKDKNEKFVTTGGTVCAFKDFKPSTQVSKWPSMRIRIPYSELHLSGTGAQTIKFLINVWDKSVNPLENLFWSETYTTSFYYNNSELKVDGNSTDKKTHFSASGGRRIYAVESPADSYETWGVPSWCSIESKTSSSFTLVCSRNTSTSLRRDYMKVKAAGKEIRIDIMQDAGSGSSATIVSVSQEHNVMNGQVKGMNIKLQFETTGMLHKTVTATAWFYHSDNVTQLTNGYGGHVNVSKSAVAPYEETTFTMTLFVPYANFPRLGTGTFPFTFDVVLTDASGNILTGLSNQSFTMTW